MKDPFPYRTKLRKQHDKWIKDVNSVYNKIGENKKSLTDKEKGTAWLAIGRYLDLIAERI